MDEAQVGHLVQLAGVACHLQECEQPCTLARPEAIAQLLEVPRKKAGGVPVAGGGLVGELDEVPELRFVSAGATV